MIGVFAYLYKVTKYRRPALPSAALILGILGPVLLAVAGVAVDLARIGDASDFVKQTGSYMPELFRESEAEDLLDEDSQAGVVLGGGGTLGIAFSLVLLNLNAMRAGILTRFLGVIGMITGVVYVIPVFTGPAILQIFWLGALVALFLDRYPNGRGPAWESDEAVPWPSAAERVAAERRDRVLAERTRAGTGDGGGGGSEAAGESRPRSRKRKRRR